MCTTRSGTRLVCVATAGQHLNELDWRKSGGNTTNNDRHIDKGADYGESLLPSWIGFLRIVSCVEGVEEMNEKIGGRIQSVPFDGGMEPKKKKHDRIESDFYETPAWCTDHLLNLWGNQLPGGTWLEAGAGYGSIIKAVNRRRSDVDWIAIELDPDRVKYLGQHMEELRLRAVYHGDFLNLREDQIVPSYITVSMGNPPYTFAEEFIRKSLTIAPYVVQLLRTTFDGSVERQMLHQQYKSHKEICGRPKFAHGATDFVDSAWFIWSPDRMTRHLSTWRNVPFEYGQMKLKLQEEG